MGEVAGSGRSAQHGRSWVARRDGNIKVMMYAQRPIDDVEEWLLIVAKIEASGESHRVPGVKRDVLGDALGESGARDVPGQLEQADALRCRDSGPPVQILVDIGPFLWVLQLDMTPMQVDTGLHALQRCDVLLSGSCWHASSL